LVPLATVPDNDDALLRAVGEGNVHAVALLYQRHGAKMTTFARRYVDDQGSAEDVVADLLGRWLERPPVVRDAERVAAFLARSVYHAAIDWIRRERAAQGRPPRGDAAAIVLADSRLAGPISEPLGEASKETLQRRLDSALEQLSEADRLLLEGHYAQALTPSESMRVLGINRAAFDQRLHRARTRLARLLAATEPAARKGKP
jgi:RNA polymerase sigma factor (sigma-70 family)